MAGEMGEREKIVVSEMVSSWFDLRREFSRQILSLSTLSTAGVYALALKSKGSVGFWLESSAILFVVCIACSLAEMYLDAKVLKFTMKGDAVSRPWLDWSVRILSGVACVALVGGAVCAGLHAMTK